MHTGFFWQIIYWSPTPILVVVAGLLLGRRLLRQFFLFFSYVVVACLRDLACFWAYNWRPASYFHTYWISHLVSAFFIFLATYELSIRRLFPRFYKVLFYRYLFSVAAFAAVGMGIFAALGGANLAIMANVISTLNFLRVLALLFFLGLMAFMGRQWNRYEFGIALGLGVDAAAFVITFAVFLKSGPLHGILRELPALASCVVSVIWLITFLKPEKPDSPPSAPVSRATIQEAQQWEKTLRESLTGKKPSGSGD